MRALLRAGFQRESSLIALRVRACIAGGDLLRGVVVQEGQVALDDRVGGLEAGGEGALQRGQVRGGNQAGAVSAAGERGNQVTNTTSFSIILRLGG